MGGTEPKLLFPSCPKCEPYSCIPVPVPALQPPSLGEQPQGQGHEKEAQLRRQEGEWSQGEELWFFYSKASPNTSGTRAIPTALQHMYQLLRLDGRHPS